MLWRAWLLALLMSAVATALAFHYCDLWIARRVRGLLASRQILASGFASSILLSLEAALAFVLILARVIRGRLPPLGRATLLACLASICAYAINDSTLKFLFGVPPPAAVLHGTPHAVHFLGGSPRSSFPSGHMALAAAFAGVFMRFYRAAVLPSSALLLLAAALLVVGNWHFLSDVMAGTFLGVSAGLLAGELWLAQSN